MRPLLADFIGWLTSAEYDDEEAYDAEGGDAYGAEGEEEKKEQPAETDA